jgi:hypothetical protein
MTGDEGLFASLDHYDNPTETIIYRDNGQGDVIGLGKIAISKTNSIEDVYHVQGLGCRFHNFVRKATIVSLLMRV